jgi:hypothetical protein
MEVTLRNALARELDTFLGSDAHPWYDGSSGILSAEALQDISKAKDRIHRQRHAETPGRVIAELNFGFWRFLLASRYESSLWTPCLRRAFPELTPQRRTTVYEPLDQLHTLRNRIAHHEPIHTRDLRADMLSIYRILNWISPDVRAWAVNLSRIKMTIAQRPVSDVAHLD